MQMTTPSPRPHLPVTLPPLCSVSPAWVGTLGHRIRWGWKGRAQFLLRPSRGLQRQRLRFWRSWDPSWGGHTVTLCPRSTAPRTCLGFEDCEMWLRRPQDWSSTPAPCFLLWKQVQGTAPVALKKIPFPQ